MFAKIKNVAMAVGRNENFQEVASGIVQYGVGVALMLEAVHFLYNPKVHDYINQNHEVLDNWFPIIVIGGACLVVMVLFTIAGVKLAKRTGINGWMRMWLVFTALWCGFLYVCNIVAIPPMAYPPAFVLGLGFAVAWIRRGFAK